MDQAEIYESFKEVHHDLKLSFAEFRGFITQDDLDSARFRLAWLLYRQGWWDGQRKKISWNQGDEAYHPDWGKVVVLDANRDGFGMMRCRQMDTEAQAIVPASPENLTIKPPICRGCRKAVLHRAEDKIYRCSGCGKSNEDVRSEKGGPTNY